MADVTKQMIYDIAVEMQSTLVAMQSDLDECLVIQTQIREIIRGLSLIHI